MNSTGKDSGKNHRIEITGVVDPHAIEALQLEVSRLARRHGIAIKEIRTEKVSDEFSE
jgi:hypothetical protein